MSKRIERACARVSLSALLLPVVAVLASASCSSTPSSSSTLGALTGTAVAGALVQHATKVTHYTYTMQIPGTTTVTLLGADNGSLGTIALSSDSSGELVSSFTGTDGSTASVTASAIIPGTSGALVSRRVYSASSEQLELDVVSNSPTSISQVILSSPQGPATSPSTPTLATGTGFDNVLVLAGGPTPASPTDVQAWLKSAVPSFNGNTAVATVDAVSLDANLFAAFAATIQAATQTTGTMAQAQVPGQEKIARTSQALSLPDCDSFSSADKNVLKDWAECSKEFLSLATGVGPWSAIGGYLEANGLEAGEVAAAAIEDEGVGDACEEFAESIPEDLEAFDQCINSNEHQCSLDCAKHQAAAVPGNQIVNGVCDCECSQTLCQDHAFVSCPGGMGECENGDCIVYCRDTDAGADAMSDATSDASDAGDAGDASDASDDGGDDGGGQGGGCPTAGATCVVTLTGSASGEYPCGAGLVGSAGDYAFTLDTRCPDPSVAPPWTVATGIDLNATPTSGTWTQSDSDIIQAAITVDQSCQGCTEDYAATVKEVSMADQGSYTLNVTVTGSSPIFVVHGTLDGTLPPVPKSTGSGTVTVHATF